jgi:hypothetical protein
MKTTSQTAHKRTLVRGVALLILALVSCTAGSAQRQKWSAQQANDWYKEQPWLVGSNYVPATAINELEMWQADSFDPQRIDRELSWAESIGMNTMRVFLHDLLWKDPEGFKRRIDAFLAISARHSIKPMFVLFDSCWNANPQLGKTTCAATRGTQLGLDAEPRRKGLARSGRLSTT